MDGGLAHLAHAALSSEPRAPLALADERPDERAPSSRDSRRDSSSNSSL